MHMKKCLVSRFLLIVCVFVADDSFGAILQVKTLIIALEFRS